MSSHELAEIYASACSAMSREPDDAQFETWKAVLMPYQQSDARAALVAWWSDTETVDWHGTTRSRGSFMPTPADLLPMIKRLVRQRRQQDEFKSCGRDGCWEGKKKMRFGPGVADFDIVKCKCRLDWEAAHPDLVLASIDASV